MPVAGGPAGNEIDDLEVTFDPLSDQRFRVEGRAAVLAENFQPVDHRFAGNELSP